MIAGFERPTAGEILLDGDDVAGVPPHQRNIDTVFQNYALFPHMNVADNVAFGLRRRKVASDEMRQRVGEALELVGLGAIARAGRTALRRPAAARRAGPSARLPPAVLLLDEPLGALDKQDP